MRSERGTQRAFWVRDRHKQMPGSLQGLKVLQEWNAGVVLGRVEHTMGGARLGIWVFFPKAMGSQLTFEQRCDIKKKKKKLVTNKLKANTIMCQD